MSEPLWVARAPSALLNADECSKMDCRDSTSQDRRWLWRLETFLAICGTTDYHRLMRCDLAEFLHDTCDHHWHDWPAEPGIGAHRQCQWCMNVILIDPDPSIPSESRSNP